MIRIVNVMTGTNMHNKNSLFIFDYVEIIMIRITFDVDILNLHEYCTILPPFQTWYETKTTTLSSTQGKAYITLVPRDEF